MDKRNLRVLEVAMAVTAVGFYVLCLAAANARAADNMEQRAVPARQTIAALKPEDRNGDYLNKVAAAPFAEASLNSQIFDKTISSEMTEKYNSFNRPYQAREAYRLNGPEDYAQYQRNNQDLVEWTIKKLLQYHFEHTVTENVEQSAKRAAEQSHSPEGKAAASAVATIQSVHKALSDTTVNMGADAKTKFKYDFPSGVMRVGMTSPVIDATMDYRIKAPDPMVGAIQQPERLSVGVSKNFRSISATTNAQYALLGQTVNYSMSKKLAGPLNAQVDQVHNIRDTSKDETVYRLNLGFNF